MRARKPTSFLALFAARVICHCRQPWKQSWKQRWKDGGQRTLVQQENGSSTVGARITQWMSCRMWDMCDGEHMWQSEPAWGMRELWASEQGSCHFGGWFVAISSHPQSKENMWVCVVEEKDKASWQHLVLSWVNVGIIWFGCWWMLASNKCLWPLLMPLHGLTCP